MQSEPTRQKNTAKASSTSQPSTPNPAPKGPGMNSEQSKAVSHASGSLAVIAGAGSGKTKVLIERIAWLLQSNGWSTDKILAVTFTNKAAAEMKKRLETLGIDRLDKMWVGTFHGLCYKFLRVHHEAAKLSASFQILDASEQEKVIKKLYKTNSWHTDEFDPKDAIRFINTQKDHGLRASGVKISDQSDRFFQKVYQAYQDLCDQNSWVDFGELLLRCAEVMDQNEDIRIKYQTQFGHILVDEFQDTNDIQYSWIKRLSDAGQAVPVTVVGDMDQSIYSWRGAQMTNVQKFIDEFASVGTVKLEQNYRSTKSILAAANALISNNNKRIEKNLWSSSADGGPVRLFEANDEKEEAEWAISQALAQQRVSGKWADTAILYRSNAQSRIFEEVCLKRRLPYKIHGGIRFFERTEIKDAMAHLAVISDINNDLAMERALTSPTKGFGAKTLDMLRMESVAQKKSWARLLDDEKVSSSLSAKVRTAWAYWRDLWQDQQTASRGLDDKISWCIENTGLIKHYHALDLKEGTDRAQNLQELISVARRYTQGKSSHGMAVVNDFLAAAALESEVADKKDYDAIQLMTIHAAKGLEFPSVCAVGWDDGIFPSSQSHNDVGRMEEERRLAYVAITRAEKHLFISGAIERRQYGQYLKLPSSRFLSELPSSVTSWDRPARRRMIEDNHPQQVRASNPLFLSPTSQASSYWVVGDKVKHPLWLNGVIVRVDGALVSDRVLVQFHDGQRRLLLPQMAKLVKIS